MAIIDIRRLHSSTLKSTKAAVEKVAKAIGKEYGVTHHWEGNQMHFDRSGIKGCISVDKDEVHVRCELGFLMSAMKPMIQSEIERKLDEHIA